MKKHHVEIDSIYSELKNILEESDVEIIRTKNFIFLYQPKNIDYFTDKIVIDKNHVTGAIFGYEYSDDSINEIIKYNNL